jgi:rhodanese-related sulfurtransferase
MADKSRAENVRITIDELKRRMQAGEEFVFIDARNPQAWAQSDMKVRNAIRLRAESLEENTSGIPKDKAVVAYCT